MPSEGHIQATPRWCVASYFTIWFRPEAIFSESIAIIRGYKIVITRGRKESALPISIDHILLHIWTKIPWCEPYGSSFSPIWFRLGVTFSASIAITRTYKIANGTYRPNIWGWCRGIYITFPEDVLDFDYHALIYPQTVWKAPSKKNSKLVRQISSTHHKKRATCMI